MCMNLQVFKKFLKIVSVYNSILNSTAIEAYAKNILRGKVWKSFEYVEVGQV